MFNWKIKLMFILAGTLKTNRNGKINGKLIKYDQKLNHNCWQESNKCKEFVTFYGKKSS